MRSVWWSFNMCNICPWIFLTLATNFLLANAVDNSTSLESIFLRLYKRDQTFTDVYRQNASQLVAQIDNEKQTILYIHGFEESVDLASVQLIVSTYLANTDANVIAANYREFVNESYLAAVESADDVATVVAGMMNDIVKSGLDAKNVHIIGYSLGSQVAGYVGRRVNFKVPRITGLDPAGPLFYVAKSHLTTTDAEFVDIIHTDIGFYGLGLNIGHVDFYPNSGRRIQPGCPLVGEPLSPEDICSHQRSCEFYAESVKDHTAFVGVMCSNSAEFIGGLCENDETAVMGYATPSDTRGTYYLTTNAESPFGRGEEGVKYRVEI